MMGTPQLGSVAMNPGTAQATPLAPPETLPSYKNDQLLSVSSSAGNYSNQMNDDLTIIPDAVRASYYKINPTATPNGSNTLYNFRTPSWFHPSEATFTIPVQASFANMTTTTHTAITGANGAAALAALAYNSINTTCFDYLWNKPFAEWLRTMTTCQIRVGNSNLLVQSFSNDQNPNIFSNVFIPSQREPLDPIESNLFLGNARNARNGNVATFTAPSTINATGTFLADVTNQIDQQLLLTDTIPGLQNALLNALIKSATLNQPVELTFPLKMFANMFNCTKSVLFPPNFSFALYINFNTQPFLVRAFGDFGLKCQVVLGGTQAALPFLTFNKLEFTAEGTLMLNQRFTSKYINHNYFETKSIPPSNALIPANSSSATTQLTIASGRPVAYAIYFIAPNVIDGAIYSIAGNRVYQDFTNSPLPNIYVQSLQINIGGYQVVNLDRQNNPLNMFYAIRDQEDIQQAKINSKFMDYSLIHYQNTKAIDCGTPFFFLIDPSTFISENQIGTIQGPITANLTMNFQEFNSITNTLSNTTRQIQMVCVEILHSQYTLHPTLDLTIVPISAKLTGNAPNINQQFAQRAVAA